MLLPPHSVHVFGLLADLEKQTQQPLACCARSCARCTRSILGRDCRICRWKRHLSAALYQAAKWDGHLVAAS